MAQLTNKYIKNIETEAYFVFNSQGVTGEDKYNPNINPTLAQRVPENKICNLANNKKWSSGYNFTPYNVTDNSNSYFYNTINNVVYVLLRKGPNNRVDEWSNYLSTVLPTHETGAVTESDYHTWFAYYKVPDNKLNFIDTSNLPVPLTFYPKDDYTTFNEKYEIACEDGVASFGCCCLYYKEYDKDEITNEIYNIGDVTNHTIFSQCYECQQLAELLDKDFIFLAGETAGNITSGVTGENPLCPATKTIKSLTDELDEAVLSSGSYLAFQRNNINSFANNSGIASITLDFTGENPDDYKMNIENPSIIFTDPTGSGAEAKIKTFRKIINGVVYHIPYGIDLISSGKDYTFADITIQGLSNSHAAVGIYNHITITQFPEDFLTNVSKTVIPKRIAYETTISTSDLINYFEGTKISSISLLLQPKTKDETPSNYTPNNNSIIKLVDTVYLKKVGATESAVVEIVEPPTNVYFSSISPYQNASIGTKNYKVYLSRLSTRSTGEVKYTTDSGSEVIISNGWKATVTDARKSVNVGDTVYLPDAVVRNPNSTFQYTVRKIIPAELNKITGETVSTVPLESTINLSTEATKSVKYRTFRITINT